MPLSTTSLLEAAAFAASHFEAYLAHPVDGRAAREYLRQRHVTLASIQAFRLGWAPDAWTELSRALARARLLDAGASLGLVHPRRHGSGHYDVLRGRVVVPLEVAGAVVGFAGRAFGEASPRYLVTRESPLHRKRETLFPFHLARRPIAEHRAAILVEGYFDAIALHQVGLAHAVALAGTALTPAQVALLERAGAMHLTVLLDGDDAGRRAVETLAPTLLARPLASHVALLPDGEDPDSFLATYGPGPLRELLHRALPLMTYLLRFILPGGTSSAFEQLMASLPRFAAIARHLSDGRRASFVRAVASHMGHRASEVDAALREAAPAVHGRPHGRPGHASGLSAPLRPVASTC